MLNGLFHQWKSWISDGHDCPVFVRRTWNPEKSLHFGLTLRLLTMRKTAARRESLHLTSRSIGNETPKLSASVNDSCNRPDHCFDKFPICDPSMEEIS